MPGAGRIVGTKMAVVVLLTQGMANAVLHGSKQDSNTTPSPIAHFEGEYIRRESRNNSQHSTRHPR